MDYYETICKLKEEFILKFGVEPTHLIIGIKDYYKLDNEMDLIDRLKYVKNVTSYKALGEFILGLKIVTSTNTEGIYVGYLL